MRWSAADDGLDSFADDFSAALLGELGQDKADPRYKLYFSVPPSDLKRPILGGQLETMRAWTAHLAKEKAASLKPFAARLAKVLKVAGDAVKARRAADAENAAFRKTGGLASYVSDVEGARDGLFTALDARRTERKLARSWPSSFFRKRAAAAPGDDVAAAKAAKLAAKKAEAEAVAAAQAKVKEAQQALSALKKPKKKS